MDPDLEPEQVQNQDQVKHQENALMSEVVLGVLEQRYVCKFS